MIHSCETGSSGFLCYQNKKMLYSLNGWSGPIADFNIYINHLIRQNVYRPTEIHNSTCKSLIRPSFSHSQGY